MSAAHTLSERASGFALRGMALRFLVVLVALALGSAANNTVAKSNKCIVGRNMALLLGLHTNDTGHQHVHARFEHPADRAGWQLDVELKTPSCVGDQQQTQVLTLSLNGAPKSQPAVPQVPPGYFLLPGFGHVRPSKDLLTFEEARAVCAAEGATLAMPNSMEEAKVLVAVINYQSGYAANWAWIGATDYVEEGKFVSVKGVALQQMGPHKWWPGSNEPNGGRGENCMVVLKVTGELGDAPCSWKCAYVCQIDVSTIS